ncbi:uncharacterized protein LOC142775581 [Rhipicephalus microplus]|uniref:uncharacterized protein LOC142775581 n=1 Tax=Rhipicephalus microplus TaxID=6941 RepID=UPI003F6CEFCC
MDGSAMLLPTKIMEAPADGSDATHFVNADDNIDKKVDQTDSEMVDEKAKSPEEEESRQSSSEEQQNEPSPVTYCHEVSRKGEEKEKEEEIQKSQKTKTSEKKQQQLR